MRMLVTHIGEDGIRFKTLVDDWPDVGRPGNHQILTRTLFSGVTNGTERNDLIGGNYATPTDKLPAPWGYQNVGEVMEIGADVTCVQVGDVVYSSANHCEYALFDDTFLFCVLPPEVERKEAALFGMSSVAMRTCRHADIRMGERVLVVGAGLIGQVAAQIAHVMGGCVTLCDVNEERLELARSVGAVERAVNTAGDGWRQEIADGGYEVVIDVAGIPGMEDSLLLAAAHRGRLMLIAGRNEVRYTFNIGQSREITLRQNSHFDNDDLANLCRLVSRGQVRLTPFLRDVVPVEMARDIYDTLRDHPERLFGTVFVW